MSVNDFDEDFVRRKLSNVVFKHDGIVRTMAKVRKPSHQLLVTYVRPKEGKYFSRSVDRQRKVERRCARSEISEAAKCAKDKLNLKKS